MDKFQISLAAARVNAGLTQEEVAKAMKVGKQTIVSWEKGNSERKEYYLGQLWDGSGDAEDIIEEDGKGCVWVGDDEDGTPVLVGFTYEELDPEELMDTVVTVTDIF